MRIRIFQINSDKDQRNLKFKDYKTTMSSGGIKANEYKCVFQGDVSAKSLDDVYEIFNGFNEPYIQTYQGHSLSTSDIVEVVGDVPDIFGKIEYMYMNEDGNPTVGDWVYFDSKEEFEKAINEAQENRENVRVQSYDVIPFKLARKGFFFCDSMGWQKVDFAPDKSMEMDGIRALMLNPQQKPIETRVINDLEHLQKAVSLKGEESYIEITYPFDDSAVVLGNEEAKLISMEGNRRIEGSVYAGPLYILNDDGKGDFCDLTDDQVEKYSKMFETPEIIPHEEVEADCGFNITFW